MKRVWHALGVIFIMFWGLAPFYWMLITALRDKNHTFDTTPWPTHVTLDNFRDALATDKGNDFLGAIGNSLIISLSTTALAVLVGVVVFLRFFSVDQRDGVDDAVLLRDGVQRRVVRTTVGYDRVGVCDARKVLGAGLVVVRVHGIASDDRVHVLAGDRRGHIRPHARGGDDLGSIGADRGLRVLRIFCSLGRAGGQRCADQSRCRDCDDGCEVKTILHKGYTTINGNCLDRKSVV